MYVNYIDKTTTKLINEFNGIPIYVITLHVQRMVPALHEIRVEYAKRTAMDGVRSDV